MSAVGTKPLRLYLHRSDAAVWRGVDFRDLLPQDQHGECLITLSSGASITVESPASGLAVANSAINSTEFRDSDPNKLPIRENEGVIGKFTPSAVGEYATKFQAIDEDGQTQNVDVIIVVQ